MFVGWLWQSGKSVVHWKSFGLSSCLQIIFYIQSLVTRLYHYDLGARKLEIDSSAVISVVLEEDDTVVDEDDVLLELNQKVLILLNVDEDEMWTSSANQTPINEEESQSHESAHPSPTAPAPVSHSERLPDGKMCIISSNPCGNLSTFVEFVRPGRAEFLWVNIKIYFYFLSFLLCEIAKILLHSAKDLLILHQEGCSYWWSGDAWSHYINSFGIDLICPEYSGSNKCEWVHTIGWGSGSHASSVKWQLIPPTSASAAWMT